MARWRSAHKAGVVSASTGRGALRAMRAPSVALFLALLAPALALDGASLAALRLDGVPAWLAGAALAQLYAMLAYRLFLRLQPLRAGEIAPGSRQERVYQVHLLFQLLLFNTLLRGGWLPIPLMRLVHLALGARLGRGSYSCGVICDPLFVRVGAGTMLGEGSLLAPHLIEGGRLAHYAIVIGNGVTVGAHAVVLAGASIGDGAIIAANSVVLKGAQVGAGEVWGGNPARPLRAGVESGRAAGANTGA